MTAVKERAIKLIQDLPEEKIEYLITIIENLSESASANEESSTDVLSELEKYIRPLNVVDDKEELYKALEEKYDSIS